MVYVYNYGHRHAGIVGKITRVKAASDDGK
jgi:hypothetical protein